MKTPTRIRVAGLLVASGGLSLAQPVILTQPLNQTNLAGATAMFSLVATGAPPLTYQWRSHTSVNNFTNIPWGTEATLLLTNVQLTALRFAAVVTDAGGLSVTSAFATLTVLVPPTITSQPSNQLAEVGETVSLCLMATSPTQPLFYQWHFNGSPVAGATSSNLALTNVQLSAAGDYFAVVTNRGGALTSEVARLTVSSALFTKVTTGPPVTDGGDSRGAAWGDYDNDGDLDLFVSNNGNNFLYRNEGNGGFTKITSGSIATDGDAARGCAWADYDNDGWLDLYAANANPSKPSFLYRNNGNGTFTRITTGSPVTDLGLSRGCSWADFDQDGYVDLFRAFVDVQNEQLYRNNGNGTFTRLAGLAVDNVYSFTGDWCDYDNDGAIDLLVAADGGLHRLYRNRGNGSFDRISAFESLVVDAAVGAAWGDYDNDGDLDLYQANYASGLVKNALYRNNGDGTFTKIVAGIVPVEGGYSWSPAWVDFDNDGFLDLFVGNGSPNAGAPVQSNFLYHNNGDGTFTKILSAAITKDLANAVGCTVGDYNNDGFVDVFVANAFGQSNALYRNAGNSNAWINLKLIGTASNRSAIGARVRVNAVIGGASRWQMREVTSGDGYTGQDSLNAEFGLGDATNIDVVCLEWPSGVLQELTNVAVRQFLNVTETVPSEITIWQQPQSKTATAGAAVKFFVQASGPPPLRFQWERDGEPITGATNRLLFLTNVQPADAGSYRVVVRATNSSVTSDAALLTVEPASGVPHHFGQISVATNGAVQFDLVGKTSYPNFDIFPVESTADFSMWTPLSWGLSSNGTAAIVQARAATVDRQFYRTPTNSFLTPFKRPTGPHPVGAQDRQFIDPSRANKRIMVTFYYPAEPFAGARPMEYIDSRLGLLHSIRGFAISNNLFAGLHAYAMTNAAIASGAQPYPVLLFSHGFTDARTFSPPRCSELASHGYVVVSIDHVDAFGTIFADGTLVTGIAEDTPFRSQERDKDLQFVMDMLATLNAGDPLLGGRLDLNRLGALGFSYGGSTAMEVCKLDGRCKAAANLDGDFVVAGNNYAAFLLQSPANKPVMILQQEGDRPDFTTFFNLQPRGAYLISIKGVIHGNFGAAALLPQVPYGTLDNRRATQIIDAYLVSFFNKHLQGEDDHLLDGPSPEFPEVSAFRSK